MSEETSTPSGEGITVVTADAGAPAEFTMNHAAKALADIREKRNQPAESAEAATAEPELSDEGNAAAVEEQPTGETQEADPAEVPPLELPRSWTKEQAEHWKALPRATQEYLHSLAGKESEAVRRAQNDAAEKSRAAEAKLQEAEKARQQYEAQLPALMQSLQDAQQHSFADIRTVNDVEKLQAEDPFRFQAWQVQQMKLQAAHAENERVGREKSQAQQTEWASHVQKENELAAEYIPELADKVKGPALTQRAAERLGELGFKAEELNKLASGESKLSLYDHRVQRLIFSDLKLSEIQSAKTAVAAKPLPPVQRPGTSRPSGGVPERVQALDSKLNNSGRVDDAVALLMARRNASRRAS